MPTLTEGNLIFVFPDDWQVTQYDAWSFYQNRFKDKCCGNKAMDFLALPPPPVSLFMLEVKDYRQYRRTKTIPLWDEIAIKARDTLAGLFAAKIDETHDPSDHAFASASVKARAVRVVLHLEQPLNPSKLFPRTFDPAIVQQKLKQLLKPIDAHPQVVELARMDFVPWTATSRPGSTE